MAAGCPAAAVGLKMCGALPRRATVHELRRAGDDSKKMADLMCQHFIGADSAMLHDMAVCHPASKYYLPSYARGGDACNARGKVKDSDYKDIAMANGYRFRDFAVETYGRMSDAARKTVKDMGRMYEELHGGGGCAPMTRAQFIDFVRRVISVALQRAIAHQLRIHHLRRIGVISKGDAVAAEICPGLNDANHRSCRGG
jgi:hypothetical protein